MAKYTQKAILQTFEAMLEEMPLDKITVLAIVARCEISSNTFYYHFHDIYDLLDTWLDQKKEAFLAQTEDMTWSEVFEAFLVGLQRNPRIVYHISGSISRERMEQYIFISIKSEFHRYLQRMTAGTGADPAVVQSLADFCCYTFLGVSMEFIWSRMEADAGQLVGRLRATFDGVLESVVGRALQGGPPAPAGEERP